MFVASVAVGRAFKTQMGQLSADECPPRGYDSVVGEVGIKGCPRGGSDDMPVAARGFEAPVAKSR